MAISYTAVEFRGKATPEIFKELYFSNDTLDKG